MQLPLGCHVMQIEERLAAIEGMLRTLLEQRTVKQHYTTVEVAEMLGKSSYSVREWCRLGRLNGLKRESGRGNSLEWVISHEELERYRQHGLLRA